MPARRNPGVACVVFVLAVMWLGAAAGCASTPGPDAAPPPGYGNRQAYVIVESAPTGATIFVNDEFRGITPMNLRYDINETGLSMYDIELRAEWADGRNDTTFKIPKGSRPQAVIQLNPNGLLSI